MLQRSAANCPTRKLEVSYSFRDACSRFLSLAVKRTARPPRALVHARSNYTTKHRFSWQGHCREERTTTSRLAIDSKRKRCQKIELEIAVRWSNVGDDCCENLVISVARMQWFSSWSWGRKRETFKIRLYATTLHDILRLKVDKFSVSDGIKMSFSFFFRIDKSCEISMCTKSIKVLRIFEKLVDIWWDVSNFWG